MFFLNGLNRGPCIRTCFKGLKGSLKYIAMSCHVVPEVLWCIFFAPCPTALCRACGAHTAIEPLCKTRQTLQQEYAGIQPLSKIKGLR